MRPVVRKDDDAQARPALMHPALAPYTFARGGITVRNRTVLAAMTNKQSHDDGTVSSDEINWLEARSIGGLASSPPPPPTCWSTDKAGRVNSGPGPTITSMG